MLTCALLDRSRFSADLLCGPETGSEGSLHEETRARGVPLLLEPSLVRRVHPGLDLVALERLVRHFRRGRYEIVHTNSSKAGILGRIAARIAGVPIVVHTAHGWAFSRKESASTRALWVNLERFCAPLCDVITVVASPDRDEALRLGIGRPEQYHLIRSGIEVEVFRGTGGERSEARSRLGVPDDAFVIGSVGRLSPQKAPLDMIAAFELVARERADARLVIVGDGPQRAEVEAAIERAGLRERVHLPGLRRDVPVLLHAFDAFALASHWEGLPRVLPQAMAARLPIVATRVNGAPDAVADGESGWLVDIGDTTSMGERLLRLARDRELARRMGARGFERVEEFSTRRMVEQTALLYENLAARKLPHRD